MLHDTPLKALLESEALRRTEQRMPDPNVHRPGAATGQPGDGAVAEFIPWGPPDEQGDVACEILATLGSVEVEYALLRRDRARFDAAMRGTIVVEGDDARDFMDRMLSQKFADLQPGMWASAFLVDRTGRLQGDLKVFDTGAFLLVDIDIHQAATIASTLEGFIFTEDVRVTDASDRWHRIEVHGPEAGTGFDPIEPMRGCAATIGGHGIHVLRHDRLGVPGYDLFVPIEHAVDVWTALDCGTTGWFAYNMARIEGGTPMCNIDFGPGTLPHETGLVPSRVSFNKGCYPGQEIVARLEHRGRPKQILRGLRMQGDTLPVAGSHVHPEGEESLGQPIGVVTSSTLSPMLGSTPIAFAMLRTDASEPGTTVRVHDEGDGGVGVTGPLAFLDAEAAP